MLPLPAIKPDEVVPLLTFVVVIVRAHFLDQ